MTRVCISLLDQQQKYRWTIRSQKDILSRIALAKKQEAAKKLTYYQGWASVILILQLLHAQ
jgi:hypothetical protein